MRSARRSLSAALAHVALAAAAAFVVVATSACPAKPAAGEQLPPSGLAGAPASTSAPLTLPGAGVPVADPSGGTQATALPPGHPPIPGGTGGDDGALPPGHPSVPGGATAAGGIPPALGAAGMPGMMGGGGGGATGDEGAVMVTGNVLETMDVPSYTYMRLKTSSGETWAAVNTTKVAVGDVVTVNQSLVMTDFFSKGLNRTFPKLVMGMMVGAPKKP